MDFPLHIYLKILQEKNASTKYLETIKKHVTPLVNNQLPVLLTMGHLAHTIDIPYQYIMRVCNRKYDPYRVFSIQKRSGGKRYICVPDEYLSIAQKWIHHNILCSTYALGCLSANVTAFKPNGSHIKNAKMHLGSDWIIKLDISNFFEAISERQIYHVFRRLGYRELVAFNLARICTRVLDRKKDIRKNKKRWKSHSGKWKYINSRVLGHLPQGAPTSPMLANLVCVELDKEIQKIAMNKDLVYTRYADDIALSGSKKNKDESKIILSEISRILGKYGFNVNHLKTKIISGGARKIITGLLVDGNCVRIPKSYKDEVKKELYYIHKFGLEDHCKKIDKKNHIAYLMRLKGKILYICKVEKKVGRKFLDKFNSEFPQFSKIENALRQ